MSFVRKLLNVHVFVMFFFWAVKKKKKKKITQSIDLKNRYWTKSQMLNVSTQSLVYVSSVNILQTASDKRWNG